MKVKTNNVPRPLIYFHELTEKERRSFDGNMSLERLNTSFFRYKGILYNLDDFVRCPPGGKMEKAGWHGYAADSYFSGVTIRYDDSLEYVVVGTATF